MRGGPVREATPHGEQRRLCVALVVVGGVEGVRSTVHALRLYHPEVVERINLLILDEHPESPVAPLLNALEETVPNLRYVPYYARGSATPEDVIFTEADADIVLCGESHSLLEAGALAALIAWFDAHPTSSDLLQGTLLGDDLAAVAGGALETGADRGLDGSVSAAGGAPGQGATPSSTRARGFGLFACRREVWAARDPDARLGTGGLLEQPKHGDGARCRPALRWTRRPSLGVASPFGYFDTIFCLNLDHETARWEEMSQRFARLEIDWRVERVSAVATPENHHLGCALSYRRMLAEAKKRRCRNVLIIEDDAIFLDTTLAVMRTAVAELSEREWDLFYLGGAVWSQTFPLAENSTSLEVPRGITTTHALAFNESVYDAILAEIPEEGDPALAAWIDANLAIDQYLAQCITAGLYRTFIVSPRVATQPALRHWPEADLALAHRYVI